jgi:hypothetical protein
LQRIADMSSASQDLRRAVTEALHQREELRAAGISASVENGTVVLEGAVDEAWLASAAETTARAVPGVQDVICRVEVRPDIGTEAQAKQTEFGDADRARAATGLGSASAWRR